MSSDPKTNDADTPDDPQDPSDDAPQAEPQDAGVDQTPDPDRQLEQLTEELEQLTEKYHRALADNQNYRKRVQKDITEARDFANVELMRSLLEVMDNMERALEAAKANHPDDDPLMVGMQLVHDNLLQTLGKFGLQPMQVEPGDAFDPDLHSAMMQQESDEFEPQQIIQQVQRGYVLKGRTIRPAAVIVAKAPEGAQD